MTFAKVELRISTGFDLYEVCGMDNYGPKAIVCVEDPRKEELQEELEEIVQENDVGQADLGSEI